MIQYNTIEEALEDLDVNIIYNPDYVSGIKTSIRLGVKSVPGFCRGVLLLPADMPNITDSYLNKMIKALGAEEKPQLSLRFQEGDGGFFAMGRCPLIGCHFGGAGGCFLCGVTAPSARCRSRGSPDGLWHSR